MTELGSVLLQSRSVGDRGAVPIGPMEAALAAIARDGYCVLDEHYSEDEMIASLRDLGAIMRHRDAESSGVTYLAARAERANRPGFAGFSAEALPPHTDRSTAPVPPRLLAMAWRTASPAGGDLAVHDFAQIIPRSSR